MAKRALLIGINYTGTNNELNGCHNDIENVCDLLCKLGYPKTEIVQMLDKEEIETNKVPTGANMIHWLKKMVDISKAGDTLYIHYSGHGSHMRDQSGDERDHVDEVICPCDGTYISDDTLNDILVKGLADGVKLRMVFDCCHSGSCVDLACRYLYGSKFYQENDVIYKDIMMISGCRDTQTSADAWIGTQYTGALTWAFTESVTEFLKSDAISKLFWKDLLYQIRYKLYQGGYSQIPQLSFSTRLMVKEKINF